MFRSQFNFDFTQNDIIEFLKNESPSVSILWKRLIEAVLLILTMEFFNNYNEVTNPIVYTLIM